MEQAEQNTCDFCFNKASWIIHSARGDGSTTKICKGVSPCHTKAVETCGFYHWAELIIKQ